MMSASETLLRPVAVLIDDRKSHNWVASKLVSKAVQRNQESGV